MSIPYADNILYNISLYNDDPVNSIPAQRYISRDQPFIDQIENYYIRLVGANISTLNIPLFIYKNDMFITIEINGQSIKSPVVFPRLFPGFENYIVYILQFLDGLNSALRRSHEILNVSGNPPIFIYDNDEIKLVVDRIYEIFNVDIIVNEIVINKLPAIYSEVVGNDRYRLIYKNMGNNSFEQYPGGIDYPVFVMSGGVKGFNSLQEFFTILVTSNSIPINKQIINDKDSTAQTFGIISAIPIMFNDLIGSVAINFIQDYPVYSDILSRGHLSEIDFKLYLVDSNYRTIPLMLVPKSSATCRFQFVNKKLVRNYA